MTLPPGLWFIPAMLVGVIAFGRTISWWFKRLKDSRRIR